MEVWVGAHKGDSAEGEWQLDRDTHNVFWLMEVSHVSPDLGGETHFLSKSFKQLTKKIS